MDIKFPVRHWRKLNEDKKNIKTSHNLYPPTFSAMTCATQQTSVQQCQPYAVPGISLGKPSHGRRPGAPHKHNSMHIAILCNKELLKAEAKIPPGTQENWNDVDSTWNKEHPYLGEHIGDHSLEREMISAQGA